MGISIQYLHRFLVQKEPMLKVPIRQHGANTKKSKNDSIKKRNIRSGVLASEAFLQNYRNFYQTGFEIQLKYHTNSSTGRWPSELKMTQKGHINTDFRPQMGDFHPCTNLSHRWSYLVIICPNSHDKLTNTETRRLRVLLNTKQYYQTLLL